MTQGKLPVISGTKLIAFLEKIDFIIIHQKGSHVRLQHIDGRIVTVPNHSGKSVSKGVLRKIIRDLGISKDEFINLYFIAI
ncbi:MAG TPA: type II toxin-antitoxin system HicA family toxin [Candidatus Acidoferrum sp.]|nr:type II toxin-antitoxin system HicA family toxin [Candidatus Acidoferrum sp.]